MCVFRIFCAPPCCVSAFLFLIISRFSLPFLRTFSLLFHYFFTLFFAIFCAFLALGKNAKQVKLQKQNLFIFVDM